MAIQNVSDLVGWYRAQDLAGATSDTIDAWPDRSSAGNDLAATDDGDAARLVADALNGRAALMFEQSRLASADGAVEEASGYSVFAVWAQVGSAARHHVVLSLFAATDRRSSFVARRNADGNRFAYWDNGNKWLESDTSLPLDLTWQILEWHVESGGDAEMYLDGEQVGSLPLSVALPTGSSRRLVVGYGEFDAEYAQGLLAELVVVRRRVTAQERQDIYDELHAEYFDVAGPVVSIESEPVAGTVYVVGDAVPFLLSVDEQDATIEAQYTLNDGLSWTAIGSATAGAWAWDTSGVASSSEVRVRWRATGADGRVGPWVESTNAFQVQETLALRNVKRGLIRAVDFTQLPNGTPSPSVFVGDLSAFEVGNDSISSLGSGANPSRMLIRDLVAPASGLCVQTRLDFFSTVIDVGDHPGIVARYEDGDYLRADLRGDPTVFAFVFVASPAGATPLQSQAVSSSKPANFKLLTVDGAVVVWHRGTKVIELATDVFDGVAGMVGIERTVTGTATPCEWVGGLLLSTGNDVAVAGLRSGWYFELLNDQDAVIAISSVSDGLSAILDLGGIQVPLAGFKSIRIRNDAGQEVAVFSPTGGVYGGSVWQYEPGADGDEGGDDGSPASCPPIIPGRVRRLEVWDETVANGGKRRAFIPRWNSIRFRRELEGRDSVTIELPRLSPAWSEIGEQAVIRTVYEDLTWEEWRIVPEILEERREDASLVAVIEAHSIAGDLGNYVVERVQANGDVWHDFPLEQLTVREHVEFILENMPSYFTVGEIEVPDDVLVDMQYTWDTGLSALRELCEVLRAQGIPAELEVQFCQGSYLVHIRRERGSWAKPARLRYGRNNRYIRKRRDASQQATRVYPRGQEIDGFSLTIEDAAWAVTAVDSGTNAVTLSGEPVGFDDMLNDLYVEPVGSALRHRILDSIAPDVLILENASGVEVGRPVHIRRDAAGTKLTYLEHPTAKLPRSQGGYGIRSRVIQHSEVPWIDNLAPNPFLTAWPAPSGVAPSGYSLIGEPDIMQEKDPLYWRYGGSSAHLVCASGEGIEQLFFPIAPTEERPYFSAMAALYIQSGRIKVTLVADTAGDGSSEMEFPDPAVAGDKNVTTVLRNWIDQFGVQGIDLFEAGARRAKLRLVAVQDGTEWWLDAVQVTQTAEAPDSFHSGRGSNDLWRAGLADLQRYAFPIVEYEVSAIDLHRLDPETFEYDYLVLGQTVELHDPEEDGLAIDVQRRIVRIEQDGDVEGDVRIELENPAQRVSQMLAGTTRRTKRRPRPRTPTDPTDGTGEPGGVLGSVFVAAAENDRRNFIRWSHNQAIEDAEEGEYTITIYRTLQGVTTEVVSGLDPRADALLGDEVPINVFALYGQYTEEAFPVPAGHPGAQEVTYSYSVVLYRNGNPIQTKEASRAGFYLLGPGLFRFDIVRIDSLTKLIVWNHTRVIEDAENGVYTVTIRYSLNGGEFHEIVSGRDPRLGPFEGETSTLLGGYEHRLSLPIPIVGAWQYEVDLLENGVVIATYRLPVFVDS